MIQGIEVQVISKILTCDGDQEIIDTLLGFDPNLYFSAYLEEIKYIHSQKQRYGIVPSIFDFQLQFPTFTAVAVPEPLEYLVGKLREYRQHLILVETFNKIKDFGDADTKVAWQYLQVQCDKANALDENKPMNIVGDAEKRAQQVLDFSKQRRIPTGFPEIDKLMYGGLSTVEELLVIIARTNSGKAQPLDSPVLTPTGWTTMGELKVGDLVVGENNDVGHVVQLFPQGVKDYYKITFSDNTSVECCDDHLWKVLDSDRRVQDSKHYEEHLVLTTRELRESLDKTRYSVDITEPVEFVSNFNEEDELDGYLLGLLIGDGSLRDNRAVVANESEEIWDKICTIVNKYNCKRSEKSIYSIVCKSGKHNFVTDKLKQYGLMGKKSIDKFIPEQYFTAPVHVRKALLAGLVDTDGYAPKGSAISWEFDTASEKLAFDFARLARSLGVWVKMYDRKPSYYTTSDGVRHSGAGSRHFVCRSSFNPFTLSEKANRYHNVALPGYSIKRLCKMIESIEYVGQTECQCILLDNKSHTYLTNEFTTTHNTWLCTRMMESAQANGFPVAYYSPEMQAAWLGTRFDTWRGHFENSKLFKGEYSDEYKNYIDLLKEEQTPAYVIEDKDFPDGVSVRSLEPFVKKNGIKLLVIDGISYMKDDQGAFSTQDKYKNIATELFSLSKKCSCAVVLIMQCNREVKSKDDKGDSIPTLYNAEGSDHPCRVATQAFGVRQIFDKHVLDIALLKSRTANNTNPVLSYAWDINTGQVQYVPGDGSDSSSSTSVQPTIVTPTISFGNNAPSQSSLSLLDNDDGDGDVEF